MGMGFAPTWLRQVSPPLLHMTTLTTACCRAEPYCEGPERLTGTMVCLLAALRVQMSASIRALK